MVENNDDTKRFNFVMSLHTNEMIPKLAYVSAELAKHGLLYSMHILRS